MERNDFDDASEIIRWGKPKFGETDIGLKLRKHAATIYTERILSIEFVIEM